MLFIVYYRNLHMHRSYVIESMTRSYWNRVDVMTPDRGIVVALRPQEADQEGKIQKLAM